MAGGQSENEVINVAEVYNPELNQWEFIAARMEYPRVGLALVSMGNMVYAMGKVTSHEKLRIFHPCLSVWMYGWLCVKLRDTMLLQFVGSVWAHIRMEQSVCLH